MSKQNFPKKGEIWLVKFDKLKEFSKPYRPCLVVSNDVQNEIDKKIVIVTITTENLECIEPFEVFIKNAKETGLDQSSKILCNYPHTIDKELRLMDEKRLGVVGKETMDQVKEALKIVLNL